MQFLEKSRLVLLVSPLLALATKSGPRSRLWLFDEVWLFYEVHDSNWIIKKLGCRECLMHDGLTELIFSTFEIADE